MLAIVVPVTPIRRGDLDGQLVLGEGPHQFQKVATLALVALGAVEIPSRRSARPS
jgi:hypothetical protein